jgi:hypothetical protein
MDTTATGLDDSASDTGDMSACVPARPDAPAISEAEMASSMAAIFCIAQVECDCPGRSHDSVESCRHSWNMTFETMRDRALSRGLTFDGECLGQLEAAVEAVACAAVDPSQMFAEVLGAGRCGVYHGDREAGQPCLATDNVASHCAQGLACRSGTCVDPCGADHGTRANPYGYACSVGHRMQLDGKCDLPRAVGQECTTGQCEPGTFCDTACIGDVCGFECAPQVGLGEVCEVDAACSEGLCESVCVAAPAEGQPCMSGRCGPHHRCEGELCTPLPSICSVVL